MLRDISGNTFVNLSSGIDPDTGTFINATSITDATQIRAVNNLVLGLKNIGIWNKMQAIYPFVGGTEAAHIYNLKDPRNLNAAYRLGFSGSGWSHTSNGIQGNGTSSYANTFFNPSTNGTLNNAHISVYSRTDSAPASFVIEIGNNQQSGPTDAGSSIGIRYNNLLYLNIHSLTSTTNTTTSLGFYVANRISSGATRNAINGQIRVISANTVYAGNSNIFIGALNNPSLGGPAYYSSRQIAFASIGSGLTDNEQILFYNIVQQYQTTLGRQVLSPIFASAPIPTVIYQPQQLFGTGLTLWYDFSDKSVLFSNTAATINVQNDNDPIMYVRNKGVGETGLNLDLTTYIGRSNLTTPINTSAITFTNNVLNSNKGTANHTLLATATTVNHLRTINGLTFSSTTGVVTSSLTFSIVFKAVGSNNIYWYHTSIGYGVALYVLGGISGINFGVRSYQYSSGDRGGTLETITPSFLVNSNKYNFLTFTIDSNSILKYYINMDFFSSVTGSINVHPITSIYNAASCRPSIYEGYGGVTEGTNTLGGTSVQEVMMSKGTVLTDDQVYKLHKYFKTKYDI